MRPYHFPWEYSGRRRGVRKRSDGPTTVGGGTTLKESRFKSGDPLPQSVYPLLQSVPRELRYHSTDTQPSRREAYTIRSLCSDTIALAHSHQIHNIHLSISKYLRYLCHATLKIHGVAPTRQENSIFHFKILKEGLAGRVLTSQSIRKGRIEISDSHAMRRGIRVDYGVKPTYNPKEDRSS
jgi:hypothetical protein